MNEELVKLLISQKMDEIISGAVPEGFKEKSRSDNRIELIAEGGEVFGIKADYLRLSVTYKNVNIIFTHE